MSRAVPGAAVALVLACASAASGQCPSIDFESLPGGTPVTTQYGVGVVFSNPGGVGSPRIVDLASVPGAYTTSGTKVLGTAGVDGLDCGVLQMDFVSPQRRVEFNFGTPAGCGAADVVRVSAFQLVNVLGTPTYVLAPGFPRDVRYAYSSARANTCSARVVVASPGAFTRVTVEYGGGACACAGEWIDDLEYDQDATQPVAALSSPAENGCVCGNLFQVGGVAYEPDGVLDRYEIGFSTLLTGPFTVEATATVPVPAPGSTLASFNLSIYPDGWWYARLEAVNKCGLRSASYTRLYLDNAPPTLTLGLADGAVVRGSVCFYGTVTDACGVSYRVQGKPAGAPDTAFADIVPGAPFTTAVERGSYAQWNSSTRPDGPFDVRVRCVDPCGHPSVETRSVIVDNTPPAVTLTSPAGCSYAGGPGIPIVGSVSDANLASWSLEIVGGAYASWTTIPVQPGDPPRNANASGQLAKLAASSLLPCPHAVRLSAVDRATDGCPSGLGGNATERIVVFMPRCKADYNGVGGVELLDIFAFLGDWFAGCP